VTAKNNVVQLDPAALKASTPSPKDKLKIETKSKDEDWYDAAFKRFSISLNRSNQRRDPLSTLSAPIKPGGNSRKTEHPFSQLMDVRNTQ